MEPYLRERWGNPSSTYAFGSQLKSAIEDARGKVAALIGASIREIVFTGSATESINTALHAALLSDPRKRHVITSEVEHSAALSYTAFLEKVGFNVTRLPVDRDGLIASTDVAAAIREDTAIVSLMWVNNETGVLFPIEQVADICKERGVAIHCDAVQAIGRISVDLRRVPIDYLSLSAHKFGGPKGIGALFVRKGAPFVPYLHGGHQERGRRGGTENVAGIVGMGEAAYIAGSELPQYAQHVGSLRDTLEQSLLRHVGRTELNGHQTRRVANTSNITFHGVDAEALLLLLDHAGVCASSGSACLSDSDAPSHVIAAMKPEAARARETIRFSLGISNTAADIDGAVNAVTRVVESLRGFTAQATAARVSS